MKRVTSILLITFISTSLYSQTSVIGVNKQFSKKDTTRTFTIDKENKDKCIEKLMSVWGKPATNNTGIISWKNVALVGMANEVNVYLYDGISQKRKISSTYTYFKDENDKQEKLKNIKENEHRKLTIEITDKNQQNIINSVFLENKIVDILTNILKDIN